MPLSAKEKFPAEFEVIQGMPLGGLPVLWKWIHKKLLCVWLRTSRPSSQTVESYGSTVYGNGISLCVSL